MLILSGGQHVTPTLEKGIFAITILFYSLTLITNVIPSCKPIPLYLAAVRMTTPDLQSIVMIALRIWWIGRNSNSTRSPSMAFWSVAAIIIQSGAVYAICLVILICFCFTYSDNEVIVYESVSFLLLPLPITSNSIIDFLTRKILTIILIAATDYCEFKFPKNLDSWIKINLKLPLHRRLHLLSFLFTWAGGPQQALPQVTRI
jgi:hypothetical protein